MCTAVLGGSRSQRLALQYADASHAFMTALERNPHDEVRHRRSIVVAHLSLPLVACAAPLAACPSRAARDVLVAMPGDAAWLLQQLARPTARLAPVLPIVLTRGLGAILYTCGTHAPSPPNGLSLSCPGLTSSFCLFPGGAWCCTVTTDDCGLLARRWRRPANQRRVWHQGSARLSVRVCSTPARSNGSPRPSHMAATQDTATGGRAVQL